MAGRERGEYPGESRLSEIVASCVCECASSNGRGSNDSLCLQGRINYKAPLPVSDCGFGLFLQERVVCWHVSHVLPPNNIITSKLEFSLYILHRFTTQNSGGGRGMFVSGGSYGSLSSWMQLSYC